MYTGCNQHCGRRHLLREKPQKPAPILSVEEILAMVRSDNLKPMNEDLSDDEILGYGV
jgi:hypothetical protein